MANEQNLIPQSERTKSEQREIARQGGIASGRARLRRKQGRELLRALLSMPEKDPRILEELERLGIASKEVTNEVAMHIRQIERAKRKADPASYKAVVQAAGYLKEEGEDEGGVTVNIVVDSKEQADKIADIGKIG